MVKPRCALRPAARPASRTESARGPAGVPTRGSSCPIRYSAWRSRARCRCTQAWRGPMLHWMCSVPYASSARRAPSCRRGGSADGDSGLRCSRARAYRKSLPDDMVGRAREIGLTQIKLSTARGVGFRGSRALLFEPRTNLMFGFRYAHQALRGGSIGLYQSGMGGRPSPSYVGRVMGGSR
jgi:hypothetical protein